MDGSTWHPLFIYVVATQIAALSAMEMQGLLSPFPF